MKGTNIENSNTFPKSHKDVENFIGESFKNNSRQSFPELCDLIIVADLNCNVSFDGNQFQFSPSKDDEVNFY